VGLRLIGALGVVFAALMVPVGAGTGSMLGGALAPRVGRPLTIVGSLLLAVVPLARVLVVEPGSIPFFAAAAAAGALLYTSSPVTVVVAHRRSGWTPESQSDSSWSCPRL
jgi:predicted MFS family arabinose efflux permease